MDGAAGAEGGRIRVLATAVLGTAVLAAAALAGCGRGDSAVSTRDRSAQSVTVSRLVGDEAAGSEVSAGSGASDVGGGTAAATPVYNDGTPLWSSNRKYSAEENARRQFQRNGQDLGASGYDDFLAKVHAFTRRPPAGVERMERSNGDVLLYDPKANLFAVVTRTGAPRTLFKPTDGPAYWEKQKARESGGSDRAGGSPYDSRNDGGANRRSSGRSGGDDADRG